MRVYHLCQANHAISNISLSRLKISRFHDLNDPFELLAGDLTDESLRAATESFKDEFDRTKGILCFSRNWKNPVLWSHYADKHRGICLGFDLDDFYAQEVKYRNNRLDFDATKNVKYAGISGYALDSLRTKYSHWQYEEEVRALFDLDECTMENGLYFFGFSDILVLKEVIIGARSNLSFEELEKLLLNIHPDVKLRKSRLSWNSYSVIENT
jgi:hypothetical protein